MPDPRFELFPQPDQRVAFHVDGTERLAWHFSDDLPRPCFFPFIGPSGRSLTRMGHPGAPDHDHHQSIWFAHYKVAGVDFWRNGIAPRIRQQQWLAYQDGDSAGAMAVRLGWYDGHDPTELLQQELIVELKSAPGDVDGELLLEVQSQFTPMAAEFEFQQTNFGFFAVRVARRISGFFGGGLLTNSEGAEKEKQTFGQPARWMDYSSTAQSSRIEGITYFDHPTNPGQPTGWHVREDGWMAASACMNSGIVSGSAKPLTLRYLLHAHDGPLNKTRAEAIADAFTASAPLQVGRSSTPHIRYEITRA